MGDNENITTLPDQLFINHINTASLYEEVRKYQKIHETAISEIAKTHNLKQVHQTWYKDG